MFDFLFGGKKKLELIRELMEQRVRNMGYDGIEYNLKIKQLGNLELIGTPEGVIVTIIETVFKLQKQNKIIPDILQAIENHRRRISEDTNVFNAILLSSYGVTQEASNAVVDYTQYRVNLEHPGKVSEEQFKDTFSQASEFLFKHS